MKKHPELSDKFPAIDGIAKPKRRLGDNYLPEEKAIRSDVKVIINMSYEEFNKWYEERKKVTERILKDYQIFASIPDLRHGPEDQQYGMDCDVYIRSILERLREGLQYLNLIKQARNER